MRHFAGIALLVMLALAACQEQVAPTIVVVNTENAAIQWDRSPDAIVFRMDVVGGPQDNFLARNEIPGCAVYGDNKVVWTNEVGPFNTQVLYDQVSDEAMRIFIEYLTVAERIYTYDAKADLQPPRENPPYVETIWLNVSGSQHKTDAFAGWEYTYYARILDVCRAISKAPVLYEPEAGWVSAHVTDYSAELPIIIWDAQASGLDIAALATSGERKWISDNNVRIIWEILRTSPMGTRFMQGEDQTPYLVALEVPSITRDSPPPPDSATPAP